MLIKNIKISQKLQNLQYSLLIVLTLTLPYYIAPSFSLLLSSLIFLITFIVKGIDVKKLLKEKTILYLFIFITLVYISALWSPAKNIFGGEFKATVHGYLNYYFLIPAIYFSDLSEKKLKTLFTFIIISPSLYVLFYFLNYFNITHIYSTAYDINGNHHLYVDLFGNLFILFSSIFLYVKFLNNLKLRNYLYAALFFIFFLLFSISLFIDETTVSRLINIAFLITFVFTTYYLMPIKYKLLSLFSAIILSITIMSFSESYHMGFVQVETTFKSNQYEGSWGHRIRLAKYGLEMWKTNPYFGRGPVDVVEKMREIKQKNPQYFNDPTVHFHNQHILILVQVGLIGFCSFLLFIYYFYKIDIKNSEINLFKKVTILIFLIVMNGEHYLQMVYTSTFFALLIGLFLVYKNEEII